MSAGCGGWSKSAPSAAWGAIVFVRNIDGNRGVRIGPGGKGCLKAFAGCMTRKWVWGQKAAAQAQPANQVTRHQSSSTTLIALCDYENSSPDY